jgi:hypothetical protein
MNNSKTIFEKLSSKLAEAMIDKDSRGWPPTCSYFAYQPVHPTVRMQESAEAANKEQN